MKIEVLPAREAVIEGGVLEDYPYRGANRIRVLVDIEARNLRGALGWWENRAKHVNKRGLSSAIWTEQTKEFAFFNLEIDMVDRGQAVELPGQAVSNDCSHTTPRSLILPHQISTVRPWSSLVKEFSASRLRPSIEI